MVRRITCNKCGELKNRIDLVKDNTRTNGYYPWCKSCHSLRQKEYKNRRIEPVTGPDGSRCYTCKSNMGSIHPNRRYCSKLCRHRSQVWNKYGLTPDDFHVLTATKKCPICDRKVKKWCVDHNHKTGETMGPVCVRCNVHVLAGNGHDLESAKRLVLFLEQSPVRRSIGERRYSGPKAMSQVDRMWAWNAV